MMVDRFATTLDCVDHSFIGDDLLDRLPARPDRATASAGSTSTAPIRAALSAVLALSPRRVASPSRVHAGSRDDREHGYTVRQGA